MSKAALATVDAAPRIEAPLAHLRGAHPPAPAWFEQAMSHAPERSTFEHQGAQIELLCWGPRGAPGLLLLHGNGAHADWYSFIAPLLAQRYRVAAFSMSGMGGSSRREAYSVSQWADEALAAADAAGLFESDVKPLFVGHSFGGFPLMTAAARYGERLAGVVIVDSPLRPPEDRDKHEKRRSERGFQAARIYPTLIDALARFRLLPVQTCEHLYIVDHIGRTSLQPVTDEHGAPGFSWRFDPYLFRNFSFGKPHRDLAAARCPVTLVRGGRSKLVTAEYLAHALNLAPPGTQTFEIADADHHVMLDQPLAFAALVEELMRGVERG